MDSNQKTQVTATTLDLERECYPYHHKWMYCSLINRENTYFGKGNTIFENWGAWVGAS